MRCGAVEVTPRDDFVISDDSPRAPESERPLVGSRPSACEQCRLDPMLSVGEFGRAPEHFDAGGAVRAQEAQLVRAVGQAHDFDREIDAVTLEPPQHASMDPSQIAERVGEQSIEDLVVVLQSGSNPRFDLVEHGWELHSSAPSRVLARHLDRDHDREQFGVAEGLHGAQCSRTMTTNLHQGTIKVRNATHRFSENLQGHGRLLIG